MFPPSISGSIRTVLKWQLFATAALAAVAGLTAGVHGALSAILGGAINMGAGVIYGALLAVGTGGGKARGAHIALIAMFRAEAGKVLAIMGGFWLTLTMYGNIIPAAFFSAFVITAVAFSMAFFVRN